MKNEILDSFKKGLQEVGEHSVSEARNRLNKESEHNRKILDSSNSDNFNLRKDLLIAVGTMFGSSIALAAGRSVNLFLFSEKFFCLFRFFLE